MNSTTWIILGVLAIALSGYAIPHGFSLRTKEDQEKITKARETADAKTSSSQVAIFQQINNNFVFQTAKDELSPTTEVITDKKEAKIIFSIPSFEIQNSHNISCIVDNASGDITIVFDEDFKDKNYYAQITGDKNINYKMLAKRKGSIRIVFEEKELETIQVVCTEN